MSMGARRLALLAAALAWGAAALAPNAAADSLSRQRKRELKSVRREIEAKRKEIEDYRRQEEKLARQVESLKSQAAASRSRRSVLLVQLRKSEWRRKELERKEKEMRRAADALDESVSSQLLQYDAVHSVSSPYFGSDDLWAQALIERSVSQDAVYLERLRGFETAAELQARDMLAARDSLRQRSSTMKKEERPALLEEKSRALREARASRTEAAAQVKELEENAAALTRLIENVRKPRPSPKNAGVSDSLAKHSLPWPAKGSVVSGYGRREIPELRTWTVQHGLEMRTALGAEVKSVRAGQVIFAGPFRSYGQVVIVDHGGQLFSLYGRLASSSLAKGQPVAQGEVLGRAGDADGKKGGVYFEIRRRGQPVNPLAWLKRRDR